MSLFRVARLLALSILAAPISTVSAQTIFGGPSGVAPTGNQGSATEKDVPHCMAAPGGSRMRRRAQEDCTAPGAAVVRTEQQLEVSLELPRPRAPQCEASTQTEYSQRNTVARVTATVSVANCPAGTAGTFTVAARVRDESGESRVLEFPESWQRDDATGPSFDNDYPIGENVDLMSVRILNLRCTCAATAAAEAPPAEPAAQPAQN